MFAMKQSFLSFFVLLILGTLSSQGQGTSMSAKMPCSLLGGVAERDYSIYLPKGYDTDTLRHYPVLYLLHGGGGSHTDWERHYHLSQVADSLIRLGAVGEMVIVCPEANKQHMMYFNAEPAPSPFAKVTTPESIPEEEAFSPSLRRETREGEVKGKEEEAMPDWKYEDYFMNELIPYIEQTYRVRNDKGGRAVAGFSMGGGAATVYGVHHPEKFCMVYDISGYLRRQPLEFLEHDPSAAWRQELVEKNNPIRHILNGTDEETKAWRQVDWKVAVGDHDFTLEANMDLVKTFREKEIPYSMYTADGAHDAVWVNSVLEDVLRRADGNFRSLWIENGERKIFGIVSRPPYTGRKQPVAIVAHGFNGTHRSGYAYFDVLNRMGFQVYAFDFPCGSVSSRSDADTRNMSAIDEKSDLQAIVRHFRKQSDVDAENIVLIGESQGGFVSALAAAEMPEEVSRLVLVFPALCIPSDWEKRYPRLSDIPETTLLWNVPLGRRFFEELRGLDVFKIIKKYKRPVLIVQGDKDAVVSMDDARRAARVYKDARLHVIAGAGHGFRPEEQSESLQQIREFLEK